ncbi:MAG: SAM-dependent DNA methyltransferase, partial [Propionibacteriales bacterium]|nr:SAM-dependent DNA methyltransferase [Propionibacteriales bacterium]
MITGELKSKVDSVWNALWSGGVVNPLTAIEQITYLLFLRRLDELHTLEENKANRAGKPMARRIFGEGNDSGGTPYEDLRWSTLRNEAPAEMFRLVSEHVFPFLRGLGADGSTYGAQMKDATFAIPNAAVLTKIVDLLDSIDMDSRDTKGDLYEYLLSEIASAGKNGQFRTPRHIIEMMVALMAPRPDDVIVDPAAGTAGFLVGAGEYVRDNHADALGDPKVREHFDHRMFHGFDSDATMLRIGSMNMLMHGVENPDIRRQDSLAEEVGGDAGEYSLVLANPPFAGSLDYETAAKDLLTVVKTRKSCSSSRCSCGCSSPAVARPSSFPTAFSSVPRTHTRSSA